MKVRYAIERCADSDPEGTVYLALVDSDGECVGGPASPYRSEDEAKATAEKDGATTWKPAPKDWQPDTYLVSQYFEDEGWDNRG